jgi:hypothetical protein
MPPAQRTAQELSLQSHLEAGLQFIAYYPLEDDSVALVERLRQESTVCSLPTSHFILDYATSASTVIYVHVIKRTSTSNIENFVGILHKISEANPPEVIVNFGKDSEYQDVFKVESEAGMLDECPLVLCEQAGLNFLASMHAQVLQPLPLFDKKESSIFSRRRLMRLPFSILNLFQRSSHGVRRGICRFIQSYLLVCACRLHFPFDPTDIVSNRRSRCSRLYPTRLGR